MAVKIKRIYEDPVSEDGTRVLVDRLWPRGVARARAAVDVWMKDVAPSDALRRWFGHEPARWAAFARRYRRELTDPVRAACVTELRRLARAGAVTLLTATRDPSHAHVQVLATVIGARTRAAPRPRHGTP